MTAKDEATFSRALEYTLEEEGGWADHPADRGGKTMYGVTIGVFRGLGREADLDGDGDVDGDDLRRLTRDGAARIYRDGYWLWDKLQGVDAADLARVPPEVMIKHFDTAVNMGPRAATTLLQRAVNRVRGQFLREDGALGPRTVRGILGCGLDPLLAAMCAVQLERYQGIVARDKTQAAFIRGWTKRAARTPRHA